MREVDLTRKMDTIGSIEEITVRHRIQAVVPAAAQTEVVVLEAGDGSGFRVLSSGLLSFGFCITLLTTPI